MAPPLKVLVIDDDAITLTVVRSRLTAAGHTVITREEAIGTGSVVRAERPDVVLVDVEMPALSGDRLAEMLMTPTERPVIILHSGRGRDELSDLARKAGADGFIEKSPGAVNLNGELERIVQRNRRRQRG